MIMRPLLAPLLLVPSLASAFSSGSTDCSMPQHGTAPSPGTGGFALAAPGGYTGGTTIAVTLTGASAFRGLLQFATNAANARVGSWQLPAGYQAVAGCGTPPNNTITHTNASDKAPPVAFAWTAPPAGTGTVTLRATVVVNFSTHFVIQTTLAESADAVFANGFE
jgi:hypothetical protein